MNILENYLIKDVCGMIDDYLMPTFWEVSCLKRKLIGEIDIDSKNYFKDLRKKREIRRIEQQQSGLIDWKTLGEMNMKTYFRIDMKKTILLKIIPNFSGVLC